MIVLKIVKRAGEHQVRVSKDGVYQKDSTYFTDDIKDAEDTMKDMAKRLGGRVEVINKHRIIVHEKTSQTEIDRQARLLLESLTPMGSEYYNNPQRCYEYIKQRLYNEQNLKKELFKWKKEYGLSD